jgi:hypothetical protein
LGTFKIPPPESPVSFSANCFCYFTLYYAGNSHQEGNLEE